MAYGVHSPLPIGPVCSRAMNNQFVLKIAAPTIAISGMLLALGIVAAWNVQRQQINSSELIAQEVHGMVAAQDLYIDMREIRHQLQQFGRSHDVRHLVEIRKLQEASPHHIELAKKLARTPPEVASIEVVEAGWRQFSSRFNLYADAASNQPDSDESAIDQLLIDITHVVDPAKDYLVLNRDVVDRTNETNRHTTEQSRQAFLLLGICGSAAGLVAGLLIARGISQSIVQLDVSVRGVAGRLEDVVGPVKISSSGGFRELEAGLQQMESHIATVVERLQQRELEVLRSEQLAAVGQLAAGMAHELRHPLMPMKMLVQAAVERDDGHGLHGQQLKVVEQEIGRLEKSIQDFLDFARPPKLEKRQLDAREAIEQTIELVSARAERQQIQIQSNLTSEPLLIEADSVQLRQVLLNLLLNAFDALPEGGQVFVSLSHSRPPGALDPSPTAWVARWALISIRDTGPGLPTHVLDRIFEPFISTKETGTGLGLSICHRIVEAHGGQITASNSPQGGAVFAIFLPPQQV